MPDLLRFQRQSAKFLSSGTGIVPSRLKFLHSIVPDTPKSGRSFYYVFSTGDPITEYNSSDCQ